MKWLRYMIPVIMLSVLPEQLRSQSASVQVNVILKPILNITVNPEQGVVNLIYNSLEDYEGGVELTQREHLTVLSTVPYHVNVRILDNEYQKTSGTTEKPFVAPDIRVSAQPSDVVGGLALYTRSLISEDQRLISDDNVALQKVFDVTFYGPGGNVLVDYVENQQPVTFTNTVLYSLETR